MLPSVFRQKIEEKTEASAINKPSVMSGFLIETASILDIDFKENPYFAPVNGLSWNEAAAALGQFKTDSSKTGFSVQHKAPGTTREIKTYINPKATEAVLGGSSGKPQGIAPNTNYAVEMVNVADKNVTPTVVAISMNQPSTAPIMSGENTPQAMQGSIQSGTSNGSGTKRDYVTKTVKEHTNSTETPLDRIVKNKPEDGANSQGGNIRTGTWHLPNRSLGEIIEDNFRGVLRF